MTRLYLSIYYLLTLSITISSLRLFSKVSILSGDMSSALRWLFFCAPYVVVFICVLGIAGYHRRSALALAVGLMFFYTFFAYFVLGKTNNNLHTFLYASLGVIFLQPRESFFGPKNQRVLSSIQSLILSTYFSAGLVKLIYILKFDRSSSEIMQAPIQHIAYAIGEGNGPAPLLYGFLSSPYAIGLTAFGFLIVVLFELFSVVVLFYTKFIRAFGVAIIAFHLMCALALGIWFVEAILASAFFLILPEVLKLVSNEQQP